MYCEKIELPSQLLLEYLNRLFYNALLFTSLFKEIPKNKYILFVGENYETQSTNSINGELQYTAHEFSFTLSFCHIIWLVFVYSSNKFGMRHQRQFHIVTDSLFYASNILIHVLMTYVFMPFREIVHTFMFSNKIKTHALPWI